MATYRVKFVEVFYVDIDAADDAAARQKADGLLVVPMLQFQYPPAHWERGWSTLAKMDGADD